MARRTGLPTAQHRAYLLCKILNKFQPVIVVAFPANPALQAAVSAAIAACEVLRLEIAKQLPEGV